jgi:release factor glutamine methyltransferase
MSRPESDTLQEIESILAVVGMAESRAAAQVILAAARRRHSADADARAVEMARECAAGKPLAYVVGEVRFMDLDLVAAPGALVARPETELLGWTALDVVRACRSDETLLIDMCCGSGNLVCGIASRVPNLRAWASDVTAEAIDVARENVQRLGLADRVEVLQSDLFASLTGRWLEGTIDVIVCNPPYISTGRLGKDRATLLEHEPREAFDGGPYGVSIVQRVIRDGLAFLKPGGTLLFEIGVGQVRQATSLLDRTGGYEPSTAVTDVSGEPRVILAKKRLATVAANREPSQEGSNGPERQ